MFALARKLRAPLDTLYKGAGYLAAVFLVMILVLVVLQMVARWGGQVMTGAPDFTGYCMAAASFLALPYALNSGSHIRVNLLLSALGKYRKWGELWCFGLGTYLACFFAYYGIKSTRESYRFNDISQGQDAWPIWIPQMSMSIGLVIFAIAFIDHFVSLIFTGKDNISSESLDSHAE
jgi:TRAP-type C4-dicarboxylate transport system permease small subunit